MSNLVRDGTSILPHSRGITSLSHHKTFSDSTPPLYLSRIFDTNATTVNLVVEAPKFALTFRPICSGNYHHFKI